MKARTIAGLVIILVLAGAFPLWLARTTYYVDEGGAANLLCDGSKCYLFIEEGRLGWATTGLQDVGGMFRQFLGGSYAPTHKRSGTVVLHIHPQGTERYAFDGTVFPLDVYQGTIYVSVFGGAEKCLCRWTGGGFEKLSEEETRALHAAERSGATAGNGQGWERHYLLSDKPVHTRVGGAEITVTLQGDALVGERITVADVSHGTEQRVWSFEKPRRVSRDEYYRIFGPHLERYRVVD